MEHLVEALKSMGEHELQRALYVLRATCAQAGHALAHGLAHAAAELEAQAKSAEPPAVE